MPSGTLPNAGSLGDPQITTGDYQTQINQLLTYVRSLQSEVAALSGTTIREGAVRGVGNGTGLLADKAVLDTRLGVTGNLNLADSVLDGSFDPENATLVWSGNSTTVDIASLDEGGQGFYLIRSSEALYFIFAIPSLPCFGSSSISDLGGDLDIVKAEFNGVSFSIRELIYSPTQIQTFNVNITEIYKV